MINLKDINIRITDRTESFFWQTDRKISQSETREIWEDKHRGITTSKLLALVNVDMSGKVTSIIEVKDKDQTNLGFINSVRVATLQNGNNIIIRCHPKGIKNGYFYVESLVANILRKNNLPAYKTYVIHDLKDENDIAFQVIEKLPGTALKIWFESHQEDVDKLMFEAGKTLAKIHQIKVNGFGSFDNELAKQGKLIGLYNNLADFMLSGLEKNLDVLIKYNHILKSQKEGILKLFKNSELLKCEQAVLVHNDYADWNLLTDGNKITGILDLDECCASDPLCDIACWMSMAPLDRVESFLKGYFRENNKPKDFDDKIKLYTLRYVISNMVQRSYRSEYINTDFLKELIELGRMQITELLDYFKIK